MGSLLSVDDDDDRKNDASESDPVSLESSQPTQQEEEQQQQQQQQPESIVGRARNAEILRRCREQQELFVDEDFPAEASSMNFAGCYESPGVRWLRPHEIDGQPVFISDGFSRADVEQGQLGNCWILASLAGLAERPELIRRIVPHGQSMDRAEGYCGAFVFHFRRFGEVVEVIVDDRLPARGGQALYSQPINGEFWVCLLEKALAKLCGCYQSLEAGHIFESLTDMTGGVCEQLQLSQRSPQSLNDLMRHMRGWMDKGCVIGASSISSDTGEDYEMGNGLVFSHAYTVTAVAEVQTKRNQGNVRWRNEWLVRVRNPWGSCEWQGRWSDASDSWTPQQRRALDLVERDDGEFWMAACDFARFFASIDVLHLPAEASSSSSSSSKDWRCARFSGQWSASGQTAGGQPYYSDSHWRNPSFVVELTDSRTDEDELATCLVSLEEPNQRHLPFAQRHYQPKAVYVYQLAGGETRIGRDSRPVADSAPFVPLRNKVHAFRLAPARYCLVPCTHEPGMEAQFLLTVFTEAG